MKIIGINLSNNPHSINLTFLTKITKHLGGEVVDFSEIDFQMFRMGIDTPVNLPPLCDKIAAADFVIFSTPEYNGTFSAFGKNVLDWISTKGTFEKSTKQTPLSGKPTLLTAVAPGPLGGIRALPSTSTVLSELGCVVVKTFATTGGYNADTFDYSKAFALADSAVALGSGLIKSTK